MAELKEEPRIANSISCHAWNGDRTKIAICPGNNLVLIYNVNGRDSSQWTLEATLEQHDSYVSGIDWSPVTNLIVTCGHDRNAYVWRLNEQGVWDPTLVILRINRAATAVKWSPDGQKFAVASGAKCVPVCHYESSNDWWISKMIKSHKSTVLCLDWHSNNKFLVTGCADKKCRIFSAFIENVDHTEDAEVFAEIWPNQFKFGECLYEFDQGQSWINAVAWSPSGFRLAFAGHNSSLSFVQILGGGVPPTVQVVRQDNLPYRDIAFLGDSTLVAVGYDNNPIVYAASGNEAEPFWSQVDKLDKEKKQETARASSSNFSSARNMFQGASSRGIAIQANAAAAAPAASVNTRHQNTINGVFLWRDGSDAPTRVFSSCGADGRVLMWDLNTLDVDLSALKIA
eukprot:TRINITY_DN2626_c0_g1_i2.p1 TRINITY_DN2626_c0_g1~~TRINITY_DN2626_c0_g1_i2.p1  ORF type:complete len:399 (+),score=144.60 TRINITY_DN2626_c0_g1_i2:70-1266(+)